MIVQYAPSWYPVIMQIKPEFWVSIVSHMDTFHSDLNELEHFVWSQKPKSWAELFHPCFFTLCCTCRGIILIDAQIHIRLVYRDYLCFLWVYIVCVIAYSSVSIYFLTILPMKFRAVGVKMVGRKWISLYIKLYLFSSLYYKCFLFVERNTDRKGIVGIL